MTKIIWISDLHFAQDGEIFGHDPRARLDAATSYICRWHSDADVCVISGDLVDDPSVAVYAELKERLHGLGLPYLPMVGNHDDRELMRAAMPLPDQVSNDFVQYAVPVGGALILCLDTVDPGEDAGAYCSTRQAWLRKALEAAGDVPVLVFAHHPPMPLGLPQMDDIKPADGAALLDILAEFRCVKHCFFGHVHRPIGGSVRGIPFAIIRSVLHQLRTPQPPWTWDTYVPPSEAPAIGVLSVMGGDVIVHYEDFCDADLGVRTGSAST